MKRLWDFLTIYDKGLILLLIIVNIIFIVFPVTNLFFKPVNAEKNIVIQPHSSPRREIPLADTYKKEPIIVKIEGPIGKSIIEAHNGKVRVKEAPETDPEKICEKTGWIDKEGPVIVCVPNRISVWIEAVDENDAELDGISW
ncbi:MAG: NusG domain II-containing protein [Halothermotrichaceae bacterium]